MANSVVDNPAADRYEIRIDGALAGFAAYQRGDSTITFTHTEIDSGYEGRGLGSVLARGALDASRAAGEAVLPRCPFIRRFIQRHPEYRELVPVAARARFDLDGESGTG